jgi:hypothetical protein
MPDIERERGDRQTGDERPLDRKVHSDRPDLGPIEREIGDRVAPGAARPPAHHRQPQDLRDRPGESVARSCNGLEPRRHQWPSGVRAGDPVSLVPRRDRRTALVVGEEEATGRDRQTAVEREARQLAEQAAWLAALPNVLGERHGEDELEMVGSGGEQREPAILLAAQHEQERNTSTWGSPSSATAARKCAAATARRPTETDA